MQRKVTCCHDCQEREVGCHSTCKKYIEENEQYLRERERIKTEKNKEAAIREVIICNKRRIMRRK